MKFSNTIYHLLGLCYQLLEPEQVKLLFNFCILQCDGGLCPGSSPLWSSLLLQWLLVVIFFFIQCQQVCFWTEL